MSGEHGIAPVDAIDYVITHELSHIAEPHHGPKFFKPVDRVMPRLGNALGGLVVGGLVFGLGQAALATSRSSLLRLLVVGVFAIPAALVGYGMMLEIWQLTMSPSIWQYAFGSVAALVAVVATVIRLLNDDSLSTIEKNVAISPRH